MVQTGLQRPQQVKSAQAKELAVLDCGECPFARPSAVDAFAAVVSLFVDFPVQIFTCRYSGLAARCWRWWRPGALPADISLGGTGCLQQF